MPIPRRPSQDTMEIEGLAVMNRRDGQRLLLWINDKTEELYYIKNVLEKYDQKQFIDYLVLSTTEYQTVFNQVARQLHIPVLDFDMERNTAQMSFNIRLLHHWRHMFQNGMPTSSIYFEASTQHVYEAELFTSFSDAHNLKSEIVRIW